jgi:hypothetical protein
LDQRLIDIFAAQLDSTENWLNSYLREGGIRTRARELAESTRRYVEYCRRRLKRGDARISDIMRWRDKLERASVLLWQAAQQD